MNGRIYDPMIGWFLSADPFVQAPTNTQNYNRYSYVWNNPLSLTDPSGNIVFGALAPMITAVSGLEGTALLVASMAAAALGSFVDTLMTGGNLGDALRSAAVAAASAYVASKIKGIFDKMYTDPGGVEAAWAKGDVLWDVELGRAMSHGVTQAGFAELNDGNTGSSFLSAFSSSIAGSAMASGGKDGYLGVPGAKDGKLARRTIAAAIVGGTASKIGGGKFANGAVTATIVHLFNSTLLSLRLRDFRFSLPLVSQLDILFALFMSKSYIL